MSEARDIIIAPVISERSMMLMEDTNTYTFKVSRKANKVQIRNAVEEIFNVKVEKVNTINVSGKERRLGYRRGRTSDWKKALVKLAEGEQIEIFEGM